MTVESAYVTFYTTQMSIETLQNHLGNVQKSVGSKEAFVHDKISAR